MPRGFDRGAETIVGSGQRQRRSGGKKFGVRGGKKKLVGVERIETFAAVQIQNVDAPVRADQFRLVEDALDLIGKAPLGRGFPGRGRKNRSP